MWVALVIFKTNLRERWKKRMKNCNKNEMKSEVSDTTLSWMHLVSECVWNEAIILHAYSLTFWSLTYSKIWLKWLDGFFYHTVSSGPHHSLKQKNPCMTRRDEKCILREGWIQISCADSRPTHITAKSAPEKIEDSFVRCRQCLWVRWNW